MTFPMNFEISSALAQFFYKGDGPSHAVLTRTFRTAGYASADSYDPATQNFNKQERVLAVCKASERTTGAQKLLEGLLDALRLDGVFSEGPTHANVRNLDSAITHVGWGLSEDGRLCRLGDIVLETGDRHALDEQLERLQRNIDDPAALLGGAKDLLEAIAKFVLEESNRLPARRVEFPELIALSFEMLGLQPAVVDDSVAGGKQVRAIYQSAKTVALTANELRNLQGTGHGRTLPTGVTQQAARYVIREVSHVAELMLLTHDRQRGH